MPGADAPAVLVADVIRRNPDSLTEESPMRHATRCFVCVLLLCGIPLLAAAADDAAEKTARSTVTFVVVEPGAAFGGEDATVIIDGREKGIKVGERSVRMELEPGTYAVYPEGSAVAKTVLRVGKGDIFYVIKRGDPEGHSRLADLIYEAGNHSGAYAHYKAALREDSSLTNVYRRYAELALELGDNKEALVALERVIRAGLADATTYKSLGDLYVAAKRYTKAAAAYERALDEGGETGGVLAGLGAVKRRAGDYAGAIDAYQRAIRLEPDSADHYRSLGDVYLRTGDTLSSIDAYRQYIDKGGMSGMVAQSLGEYEFGRRHFEDAARYLSMVKGKRGGQFEHLLMLGESYYRIGDFKQAYPVLRLAANKFTRHAQWPEAVEMLIKSYIGLREYKKADFWVDKYAKVSRRRSPDVAYFRAYLQERSAPAKARALYTQNSKTYPRDHRNYLRLGLLNAKDKSTLTLAVSQLKKAVALADTIPETWLQIAHAYRRLGKADDELSALQVFLASDPQHPDANARVGELMLAKGRTGAALQRLETASKTSSDDPRVLKALARGYAASGRSEEAIEALLRAEKDAPDDPAVQRELVKLYTATGEADKVLETLERLIELDRDNATLLRYARLLHQKEKYREAANAIEDIRATDPTNIAALMLLGRIRRDQGKHDDAVDIYAEVAQINPDYVMALFERAETHLEQSKIKWAQAFYERALRYDKDFARAELGLAKVAKVKRDRAAYARHLDRARRMDPSDPAIREELSAGWE
ncbi:MAG: tetratricopeptide repeat protein [Chitinivibrionales bacterium]|nr:tetratricopeptide repeat protein [Chitinivibrionales bacterium]